MGLREGWDAAGQAGFPDFDSFPDNGLLICSGIQILSPMDLQGSHLPGFSTLSQGGGGSSSWCFRFERLFDFREKAVF